LGERGLISFAENSYFWCFHTHRPSCNQREETLRRERERTSEEDWPTEWGYTMN